MYLKSFLKGSSPLTTRGGVTCQILDFFFVLYWFNGCGNSDEESNYEESFLVLLNLFFQTFSYVCSLIL